MTSLKQTSLFTEEQSTSSPEDSHVNPTQWQESVLARRMSAISGRTCLERFGRFGRVGSWAKTFSALLVGMEGWYSTRCRLTWKLKGTRYNRMYFQLSPSTLPIEETGFGLLPTPLAQAREQTNFEAYDARMERLVQKGHKPFTMPLDQMALRGMLPTPLATDAKNKENSPSEGKRGTLSGVFYNQMLPTPTAMDSSGATANMKSSQVKEGSMHSVTLSRALSMGMLPTPTSVQREHPERVATLKEAGAKTMMSRVNGEERPNSILDALMFQGMIPTPTQRDWKGGLSEASLNGSKGQKYGETLPDTIKRTTGIGGTSQLNPRFVAEMMGFPPGWTELPFQSGGTSPSRDSEMQ